MFEEPEDLTPEAPADESPAPAPVEVHTIAAWEAEIDTWFQDTFHGLGSRLEVDLYNHFHAAKDRLKALLVAHL